MEDVAGCSWFTPPVLLRCGGYKFQGWGSSAVAPLRDTGNKTLLLLQIVTAQRLSEYASVRVSRGRKKCGTLDLRHTHSVLSLHYGPYHLVFGK